MQFDQSFFRYYLYFILFGIVICIIVFFIKSEKIRVASKGFVQASGQLFRGIISAFPPAISALIVIIIGIIILALFSINIKPDNKNRISNQLNKKTTTEEPSLKTGITSDQSQNQTRPSQDRPENLKHDNVKTATDTKSSPSTATGQEQTLPSVTSKLPVEPTQQISPSKQELLRFYLNAGEGFYNEENYTKAIEIFEQVLKLDPDNKEAIDGIEQANMAIEEDALNSKITEIKKNNLDVSVDNSEQPISPNPCNQKPVHIILHSNTPGAQILINDNHTNLEVYKGTTSERTDICLDEGFFNIKLSKEGYKEKGQDIMPIKGIDFPINMDLEHE